MTEKVWGTTECLYYSPTVEVHRIVVKPGGYCSVHRHHKLNQFQVVSGELKVLLFEPEYHIFLGPGDRFTVPTMRWHQFQAAGPVEAMEVYVPAALSPEDIERRSEGGLVKL